MNLDRDLEASIRRVMAPDADDAVARRALARLDATTLPPQKRGLLAAWWPAALTDLDFAPAWPRLAALAGAAALGITVGLSGLGTRIAADLDLVRSASVDETSTNILETDSLTGLRQ
jgi:hypothetical protein